MLVISEQEVLKLATFELVLSAVTRALRAAVDGSGSSNPVVIGRGLNEGETYSVKSGAARGERIVGLKVGSYWPLNPALGLPRHASSILLLNPDSGRLTAVVEASALNGLRTAAADAAAVKVLAHPEASTLALFGAGHQAAYEARAICAVRPIRRILVVSRTRGRAVAFSASLSDDLKRMVLIVEAEQACREADIIVTATPARAPLFKAEWVRPGTHVASMGSDQVGKQELPIELLQNARLFCDLPSQSISIGEFQHVRSEVEGGQIRLTAIGEVLGGVAPGRLSPREITVFDSSGLALQDLFVGAAIVEASRGV